MFIYHSGKIISSLFRQFQESLWMTVLNFAIFFYCQMFWISGSQPESNTVVFRNILLSLYAPEAVAQRCSVKKVFLEISQNSQENTGARASFLIKLQCVFCEISRNIFSYNTPPVAASGFTKNQKDKRLKTL